MDWAISTFLLLFPSFSEPVQEHQTIACHVAIVGGGVAGLYTAYQLSKLPEGDPNRDICLFEKEQRLGGRVYDVPLDKTKPDLVFGLGALRVMEGQNHVFALAEELGIELEKTPYQDDLISARGVFVFSSDELNRLAYPFVSKMFIDKTGLGTENKFWDKLFENRSLASSFYDMRSFTRHVLQPEGYQFFTDSNRFRAEYIRAVDARGVLDYTIEDQKQCCTPFFPKGGMSQFVTKMAERARQNGVRIFMGQPVQTLDKIEGELPYRIITPGLMAESSRLILAADPPSLKKITGSVAKAISEQPQFQDLVGMDVVVVDQQWPEAWWLKSGYEGKNIHRAWTTEHCLNSMEIPKNDYAASQLVTRSVSSDNPNCNEFWQLTLQKGGMAAIEAEIKRGLNYLFPHASIPNPKHSIMKVWPAGWYWLKGGSAFTSEDIANWAEEPLPKEPVSLVGDAYFIIRSGWIDGAIRSSKNALRKQFGLK